MDTGTTSKGMLWGGRILSILLIMFFLFDSIPKIIKADFVLKATKDLGFPEFAIPGIGIALLVATILYVIPRTAILGAILITGYLGGATATQIFASTHPGQPFPLAGAIAFPVVFGILVWLSLWLQDGRLRSLIPLRK
jgi:peptidoglycan/LPS O-acetylase OafA/YrhL